MELTGESQGDLEPLSPSSSSHLLCSSPSHHHVISNDSLTRRGRGFIWGDLPDEPLTMVLQQLEVRMLQMVTGVVSKSWSVDHLRAHVWCALGAQHKVHMTTGARMSLRSTADQRKAFFQVPRSHWRSSCCSQMSRAEEDDHHM
eukprot:2988569-Rhodomonas_salina.1